MCDEAAGKRDEIAADGFDDIGLTLMGSKATCAAEGSVVLPEKSGCLKGADDKKSTKDEQSADKTMEAFMNRTKGPAAAAAPKKRGRPSLKDAAGGPLKATGKAGKAAAAAKPKAKGTAKAKAKTKAATAIAGVGCSKCRYSEAGCAVCLRKLLVAK